MNLTPLPYCRSTNRSRWAVSLAMGMFCGLVLHASASAMTPWQAGEQGAPVGTKIDEFSLPDQEGNEQSWSQILAQGPVAVVFHRSADW